MAWPKDPEKRALARERHRAAQRARWQRSEEREKMRAAAVAQFAQPGAREEMSAIKKRQYAERPELRARIARTLSGRRMPSSTRRAIDDGRLRKTVWKSEQRKTRRDLIADLVEYRNLFKGESCEC